MSPSHIDSGGALTGELRVSPYDTQGEVIDFLSTTDYTLKLRFYQITDQHIFTLLNNLDLLGVKIQGIVENTTYGQGEKEYNFLIRHTSWSDIQWRSDEHIDSNFMHAKVAILDDNRFLLSTANLSYPSFWNNREYRFISTHPWVTQSLVTIFNKDRTGEAIMSWDIDTHLMVCPVNCRSKIMEHLSAAQKRIIIQAQYLEDRQIVDLLHTKKSQWVQLSLLVGEYQWRGWLTGLVEDVRVFDELYLHTKNILIDDTTLLMWSMNLSTNALDENREFGLIIDDMRIVKKFQEQFGQDRANSNVYEID